ncbi:MAG TPA: hypothetical protein PKI11_00195 [Candidatus Hydrogenedentes bacterium]|nr:hypothetical protein [Candidatus Hydrogenedentota bacterium]HNT89160.1 hypothetical protein [Candidatus Hydrogenedentota bacterium]
MVGGRYIRVLCLSLWLSGAWAVEHCSGQEPTQPNGEEPRESAIPPDWEPVELDLPSPLFVGTPRELWTPNLGPPSLEPRKPFFAPKGVANVAEGARVTAGQSRPLLGDLEQVTDGDKAGSDGSFIEIEAGLQYIQIDLGNDHEIFAVVVWHFHMEPRVYFDVVVRVADDPDFIANARTLFNNDHDNSAGFGVGKDKDYIETYEGKVVETAGTKARYLRLYSRGNTSNELNHYIEVEVYGKPGNGG